MRKDHGSRLAGIRKRTLLTIMALMVPLAALTAAPSALATPKGPYEVFKNCPASTIAKISDESLCLYGLTTSGKFEIKKLTVPINQTITLQSGAIPIAPATYALEPATNGESLSKTELNVPGGLLNIINCEEITGEKFFEKAARAACKAVFENKTTGVTATTEIVANEHNPAILNLENLIGANGSALTLPVRVHLKNPFLGNSCYIGSESSPIQLHLTTGRTSPPKPNEPIKGNPGLFEESPEAVIISIVDNTLVDNAWSAPVSEGCGEFLFVKGFLDGIVNSKLGLPSAAGNNTAILSGELKASPALAVLASEG